MSVRIPGVGGNSAMPASIRASLNSALPYQFIFRTLDNTKVHNLYNSCL